MKFLIFNLFLISFSFYLQAEISKLPKVDFEGCPENAICSKTTGANRNQWLNIIKSMQSGKITEIEANEQLIKREGIPISAWATEKAIQNDFSFWWDSPCKQHQLPNEKYFLGDVFTKTLSEEYLKKHSELIFAKAILKDGKDYKIITIPRGDSPLAIINNNFYYTKDDDGNFYGLNVSKSGNIKISKTKRISNFPHEIDCPKEMSAEFYRTAPHLNFYKGHFCKEIWDMDQKIYQVFLMGWSCN